MQRQKLHTMQKRLFSWIIFSAFALSGFAMPTLDSLLTVLDDEVAQSAIYCEAHARRIDSLKAIRPMTNELQLAIAREYQYYQSDSASDWYLPLLKAKEPYRTQAYLGLVELASSIGKYADGMLLIPNVTEVPDSLRVDWIEAVWRLHTEAAARTGMPELRQQWLDIAGFYYDSLLNEMGRQAPNSCSIRLRYEFLQALDAGNYSEALNINDTILSRIAEWSHPYAIEAYSRAFLYESMGNDRERFVWLTRSAIADVRCGITDNGSSWLVAKECYESNDLSRAYHYSDYSLTNASFYNAPIALIAAFALLLVAFIAATYVSHERIKLRKLNKEMQTMNEQLRAINRQLKEADKVKEQYICRYLEVYSDYIRRLTTMARRAGEKDPSAFMDREMENFYRSFDDTFLSLYGSFIDDFNALLKPEAQVVPKPGERLTIEMRIFALILLGITSSAKIAELLCYSPNTISNYRVKMKNGALGDRDTFEQRVQQIGKGFA